MRGGIAIQGKLHRAQPDGATLAKVLWMFATLFATAWPFTVVAAIITMPRRTAESRSAG
jgi:hypothetical protein